MIGNDRDPRSQRVLKTKKRAGNLRLVSIIVANQVTVYVVYNYNLD